MQDERRRKQKPHHRADVCCHWLDTWQSIRDWQTRTRRYNTICIPRRVKEKDDGDAVGPLTFRRYAAPTADADADANWVSHWKLFTLLNYNVAAYQHLFVIKIIIIYSNVFLKKKQKRRLWTAHCSWLATFEIKPACRQITQLYRLNTLRVTLNWNPKIVFKVAKPFYKF